MKYCLTTLAVVLLLLLSTATATGQTFQQCADVNENGSVNLSDVARMIDVFIGGPDLPVGRGDVDFRQNFNLGDLRYLTGYLFMMYPEGGCPPFPNYTMINTTDSLFLPEALVPIGNGTLVLPIIMSNDEKISDLLITATLSASNCVATIDSAVFANWSTQVRVDRIIGNDMTLLWSGFEIGHLLQPGLRSIANVYVSYSASTGGTVSLNPTTFGPNRFIHQVYGDLPNGNYSAMNIGVPNVIVGPTSALPAMSVSPDSLAFVTLDGSGDPTPQTFDVLSDGDQFDWTSTQTSWIQVTPSGGLSGTTVSVQPLTASLNPGTHVGTIVVSSPQAYNSPKNVKVVLRIQPQYPAFDANCDGIFNISDIVYLLVYIFGGPAPCDPGAM